MAAGVYAVAALGVVTDIAADLQAGLGARNLEEALAVCIANANVFDSFRFGDDNCVSSARASYCNQSCSGAE